MAAAAEAAKCGPLPADDQAFQKLKHIGPTQAARAAAAPYNVNTIGDLRTWVAANRNSGATLRAFVNDITENARPGACIEGYVVNRYNLLGRLCLVRTIRTMLPTAGQRRHLHPLLARARAAPSYAAEVAGAVSPGVAAPIAGAVAGRPAALPAGSLTAEPFHYDPRVRAVQRPATQWEYPYADRRFAAFDRRIRGRGAGRGRGTRFPYGRAPADDLPAGGRGVRRQRIRRVGDPQSNRQHWPCTCFASRDTCEDAGAQVARAPGMSSCEWAGGACRNRRGRRRRR